MVDNLLVPFSFQQIFDTSANSVPANGAKLTIFDAGTTNVRTSYTDNDLTTAHTSPIVADSDGVFPAIYLGTGEWKFSLTNSSDVVLQSADNITGALDTSSFLTGTVSPSRATRSITSTTTLTDTDDGLHVNADASGGDFTVTLRSAVAMGDGGDVLIKNSGTSGIVTIATTGGQTIDGELTRDLYVGDAAVFRSDGANYLVGEGYRFTDGIVTVTFSAAIDIDVSLYPSGVDYQITATSDFTLTTSNDRPGLGYTITIIQDATGNRIPTFNAKFKGDVSIDLRASAVSNIGVFTRTVSDLDFWLLKPMLGPVPDIIAEHQQSSGTDGGAVTVSASFQKMPLNTAVRNVDSLGFFNNDLIGLDPGTYYAEWSAPMFQVNSFTVALFNNNTSAVIKEGSTEVADAGDVNQTRSFGSATFTLTVANAIGLFYRVQTANPTNGLGRAGSFGTEVYGQLKIWRI